MVPWVGLQCVIVVFPDHTYLLFCKAFSGFYQGCVSLVAGCNVDLKTLL